jgi:hypothetical protein
MHVAQGGLAEARPLADNEQLADHLQGRLDHGDVGVRPKDHDGERALFGAAHASANRAVDLYDVACTQLFEMRPAITAPVVDRSTKRPTFLPSITPPGLVTTASTMSGVGRLAITVSAASATSAGERAAIAPRAARLPIAS